MGILDFKTRQFNTMLNIRYSIFKNISETDSYINNSKIIQHFGHFLRSIVVDSYEIYLEILVLYYKY